MTNILDNDILEYITQEIAIIIEHLWNKYSKFVNITKWFKKW